MSGGGQDPQPGGHPNLERQEGDDLRQRHDVGGGPAGIQQRLQPRRRGVARMEDQEVRVIEGGGQARPQGSTRFGRDMIARGA